MSSCRAVPADLVGNCRQVVAGGRNVDRHHGGAVPVKRPGNRRTDAARGAGHDGDLPGERLVGVVGQLPCCGSDPHELAVHKRGPAGEEEAQRSQGAAGAVGLTPSARRMPLPVAPARSSLARERSSPSTPCRAAADGRTRPPSGTRETVTTRPFGGKVPQGGCCRQDRLFQVAGRFEGVEDQHDPAELFLGNGVAADVEVPGKQRGGELVGARRSSPQPGRAR